LAALAARLDGPVHPGSNRLVTLALWVIGGPLLTTVLLSAIMLGW
jgi:hypothetical protein